MHEKLSGTALNIARMPSLDTFNRVFQIIDPMGFKSACKAFVRAVYKGITGKDIAIDGKTLRGGKMGWQQQPRAYRFRLLPRASVRCGLPEERGEGGRIGVDARAARTPDPGGAHRGH